MSEHDGSGVPSLEELPEIELPASEDFVAQEGAVAPLEGFELGTATDLGWEFCLLFNGRAWQTVMFRADTAAEAAGWMEAYTRFVNSTLARMGYPPGICSWISGRCR